MWREDWTTEDLLEYNESSEYESMWTHRRSCTHEYSSHLKRDYLARWKSMRVMNIEKTQEEKKRNGQN
jgi:hypothetical protein